MSSAASPPPLFRAEVQQAKQHQWLGQIVLIRPPSFRFLTLFALISTGTLLMFLCLAQYTKRTQAIGLLTPDAGLIKIQSSQVGVILERRVKEGQVVQAGDVLFALSTDLKLAPVSETAGAKGIDSSAAVLASLRARQQSLQDERAHQNDIAGKQAEQLSRSIASLQAELLQLDQEIATQQSRLSSAQAQLQRHQQLAEKNFISPIALQQKQDEMLDQQSRLQVLQRSRLGVARDLSNAQGELATLPSKNQRDQNQLERQSQELEEQTVSTQAHRQFYLTAPQAGTVTAILADPGQMAGNQTLLTILPANANLEAQLYVPSRAVGFIESGQKVSIRFAAYPYQKFGQYQGVVQDVSRTALAPGDIPAGLADAANNDGMYRVRVALNKQTVTAYGKAQGLTAGMHLDADILQDRRSLLEWVFEPLYSLKGKLSGQ
ncbi:MAG TPA: HlyD family efflux transporter periplasmic adaptor subunit [Burkholderiaceae bacterium]|jgi:membrane fusion protein